MQPQGAKRPTPTQSTCLYYCHDNEANKWCCDSLLFWSQILFKGNNRSENATSEQEHRSSGRQHVLEYGLQDGEAVRAG